jgi:alkylation response protein AidB-like acyl-CoA dehydrogenase
MSHTIDAANRASGAVMRGGEWLIADEPPAAVMTRERLPEEYRLIAQTAHEFMTNEAEPALEALERKDWSAARRLLRRCGDLGLLGVDAPESLGGIGLDKVAALVVVEAIGANASVSTIFGAQSGLVTIPLLCFGTPDQQQRYLPRILSGEMPGAYCLSESGSGSDAMSVRTRAARQADGSWRLDGEKMWITNGGFADVFIVFAKADGDRFSAFIVERGFPGVSSGREEHKMGLHGSSTTPLLLAGAEIPAGNLLGDIGKGHKIAFNVLNYGRFKLAGMCSGGAKAALAEAATYASSRRQFNRPIAAFGAIRHKLAEMTIRVYVVESMLYRMAGWLDTAVGAAGHDPVAAAAALEEFAIEASLLKVAGSEMTDYVVDENVQIHGGNGFVRDYAAERRFRDARVNRIFEGTNEINRLLVPAMLLKRAQKGGTPVLEAAGRIGDDSLSPGAPAPAADESPLDAAARALAGLKRTALLVLGRAARTYGDRLADEQEVTMLASNLMIEVFGAESAWLRARQAVETGHVLAALHTDAAVVAVHDASLRAESSARTALSAMHTGDTLRASLSTLRRCSIAEPVDTVSARRRLADAVTRSRLYLFA